MKLVKIRKQKSIHSHTKPIAKVKHKSSRKKKKSFQKEHIQLQQESSSNINTRSFTKISIDNQLDSFPSSTNYRQQSFGTKTCKHDLTPIPVN